MSNSVVGADQSAVSAVGSFSYGAQRSFGWQRLGFKRRDALLHVRERGCELVERLAQACVFRHRAVELQSSIGEGLGQRAGRMRCLSRTGDASGFIGGLRLPVVWHGVVSADRLGARNDV